jgi:hypothetical protein
MMEPLDNGLKDNIPKAEPCSLLSSNTDVIHGSAFGFNQEPPIEALLDELAAIIVEAYFYDKRHNK